MKNHVIQCKNCAKTVAKTPNQTCVYCKMVKWGYTDAELWAINNPTPVPVTLTKLVCNNCNTLVAKTPNNTCLSCSMPNWGYSPTEIAQGRVKLVPDVIVTTPTIHNPTNNHNNQNNKTTPVPFNSNKVLVPVLIGLLAIMGVVYLPDWRKDGNNPIKNNDTHKVPQDSLAMAVAKINMKIGNRQGSGTAFLVSPTKLVTAAHCVLDFEKGRMIETVEVIFTKLGNKKMRAKVLKIGSVGATNLESFGFFEKDYALLEIPRFTQVKPLQLGNSDNVKELDEVMTIGHSLGVDVQSFTDGKINSLRYEDGTALNGSLDMFKHTITSNHGNSGGPIFSKKDHKVIGILVGGKNPNSERYAGVQGEKIASKINNAVKELGINVNE